MTERCLTCGSEITAAIGENCPECGEGDPFGRLSRIGRYKQRHRPSLFEQLWERWGTFVWVLGISSAVVLLIAFAAADRPRSTDAGLGRPDAGNELPSVPLSTYESIRAFDGVTAVSAEGYRQMLRTFARACGASEQEVVRAVQAAVEHYREEGVPPEGRLAQYTGIAAQRLSEKGDLSCAAFLGTTLMAGAVEAKTSR